jgi:hypothetical protein
MTSAEKKLFSFLPCLPQAEPRIALILPGFGRKPTGKGYLAIGGFYQARGIAPVYVAIDWRHTRIGNAAAVAERIGSAVRGSLPDVRVWLFGFSFGAAIACKVSESLHCEQVLLCSMSPVFAGDRRHLVFPFRQIMGLFAESIDGCTYSPCGENTVFLYGDHDNFLFRKQLLAHRAEIFSAGRTVVVKGARHNPSGASYREAIRSIIGESS